MTLSITSQKDAAKSLREFLIARHFDCVEVIDASLIEPDFVSGALQLMFQKMNVAVSERTSIDQLALDVMDYLDERAGFDWSRGIEIDADHTLCISYANDSQHVAMILQRGPLVISKMAFDCALESWQLSERAREDQQRLDITTRLIVQSQNEKTWLRSFATSLGAINRSNAANTIAQGIFEPLRHLLKAESLFLIVESNESERSGLQNCKFGSSLVEFEHVELAAAELRDPTRKLILRNFGQVEGIRSLLGAKIAIGDDVLGYLVAINRTPDADGVENESFSDAIELIEEAAALFATQTQNIHLVLESHQLVLGALHAMSSAIDARDPYTQGHSERVAKLGYELARILGISESACQEIYLAGLLHDLGKIGIPDHILHKAGPLTDEEFSVIKQHPAIGHRIIEQLGKLHFVLPGVLYHHERWDGLGYPHQLKRESIPLMARILAVADSFDAMTSSRPYRGAMPIEKAAKVIRDGAGKQWDEAVVDCFEIWLSRTLPAHPVGAPLESEDLLAGGAPFDSISQVVIALNL